MLVEGDKLSQHQGSQPFREYDIGWPVSLKDSEGYQRIGNPLGAKLCLSLSESKGLGLREEVRRQDTMVVARFPQWTRKTYKIDRDQLGPLMENTWLYMHIMMVEKHGIK